MRNAPEKTELLAKSLIAFGVLGAVFGLSSALFVAFFAQNVLGAAVWGAFVCFGVFLLVEWIQFLRDRFLLLPSPRLWVVSAVYISLIILGLLGFVGYIVRVSLTSEVVYNHGEPVNPADWLKFVLIPLALVPFAVCGFIFSVLLWRQAKSINK